MQFLSIAVYITGKSAVSVTKPASGASNGTRKPNLVGCIATKLKHFYYTILITTYSKEVGHVS